MLSICWNSICGILKVLALATTGESEIITSHHFSFRLWINLSTNSLKDHHYYFPLKSRKRNRNPKFTLHFSSCRNLKIISQWFQKMKRKFFCRESFQGVYRKENEPSSYCLQFFWLMEKQKGKFLRYSRQVSSWWLVILFQRKMGKHQDTLVKYLKKYLKKYLPRIFNYRVFPTLEKLKRQKTIRGPHNENAFHFII